MGIWTEKRTIIAYALSIIALAEIIDLTIVSVAIPDLMGALGANINDISLTMTSYIVAAAICIPLTGLVTDRYGIKNVALFSTIIFGIASILCGTATNLNQMIIYRLIQGVGGAFLPALAQSYVVDNFTEEEQPKVMTILTLCIVLGPIVGPIMGGYIVEHTSWRWIFFVNVPVCILGLALISILMEEKKNQSVKIDYTSFIFMAIGIGCLEYFVDEGNTNSWLQSITMICFLATAIIFIGFFIWRGLLGDSVVKFAIFKNNNFVLSCLILFIFFAALSGCLSFFPSMLQIVYGMPVDTAGFIQAPRGVAAIIGAPIYLLLSKRIDARILMTAAMIIAGVSTMCTGFLSTEPNMILIIALVVFQGFGMIGVFVLLMSIAYIGVTDKLSADSSGVFNFFRNFSVSIGTSIASTLLFREQQTGWNSFSSHISDYAIGFHNWVTNTVGLNLNAKVQLMANVVDRAAIFQSYVDLFYISGIVLIIISWLPFLLKKPDPNAKVHMGH